MADPLIGKQIGQYEVQALLGQGGMAVVYRAYQGGMKRDVAMKIVSALLTQDPKFRERFNREVEFIASLEHSHIIPVHDHGVTEDGIAFLTMRYLKGGTLTERIRSGKPLSLSEANRILQEVAGALDYAHKQGVIHRDIKPNNILLDEHGAAYLADFGLARMVTPGTIKHFTEADTFLGTPAYIAPEQVQQANVDERSDIYSLGVVLYEMLAGRPPFTGDSAFDILRAHIDQKPPPLSDFRPELGYGIAAVLKKALEKKPDDRYQTASELATAFSLAAQGDLTTQPLEDYVAPRIAQTQPTTSKGVTRIRFLGASIIGLLLLSGIGILATRSGTVLPSASTTSAPTTPATTATVADSARPDKGTFADLVVTDGEAAEARLALQGSFIGMIACVLSTDYHASLARAVRTRAEALNLPIEVVDSANDAAQQPIIINRFVAQGAKALVICELDPQSIGPALADVQNAGVKVVRLSEIVAGPNSVSLTFTNDAMGSAVGNFTADWINSKMGGKATVAILDYPSVPEKTLRAKAPGATIVGRYEGGLPDNGEKSIAQALLDHPDINIIMSINDAGAYGAVKALQKAGKDPASVKIISVDAETEARRMISAGQFFAASVDSNSVDVGTMSVNAIVKMLAGAPVPKQIFLPGNVVTFESLLTPTP